MVFRSQVERSMQRERELSMRRSGRAFGSSCVGSEEGVRDMALSPGPSVQNVRWGDDRSNVRIPPIGLAGTLNVPAAAHGLVAFAHGSGSSRFSPRNNVVAEALNADGIATLLFDLLTTDEESNRSNIFDIPLLAERLVDAVRWLDHQPVVSGLPLGLFGASTGAGAALMAAVRLGDRWRPSCLVADVRTLRAPAWTWCARRRS
jgi:hypothetical protein